MRAPIDPKILLSEAERLVDSLGEGRMSATAYDTAWVARLSDPQEPQQPLFPASVQWLLQNQHSDGSWGADLYFAHDRLISTLSGLVALAGSAYRSEGVDFAVRRAIAYLYLQRPEVRGDPIDTVGFELLLPELLGEARGLGLRLPYEHWEHVEGLRAEKLSRIPPIAIYGGSTTLTTSLEHQGERLIPLLVDRCQAPNGSFGGSPSATAYVLSRYANSAAQDFLHRVGGLRDDGGVVFLHPFETFESAWVLYYLGEFQLERDLLDKPLQTLLATWTPTGTGWTHEWSLTDSDDTAVVFRVLGGHGYELDANVFTLYEGKDHFYCFPFERDASIGANAHILEALTSSRTSLETKPLVRKLVDFLTAARIDGRYWMDKWHASPLYATHQCLRAIGPVCPEFMDPTTGWILEAQHEDGSWGSGRGNCEETALALASLLTVMDHDPAATASMTPAADRGAAYLTQHFGEGGHPALWRGKSMYRPDNIVEAIILSALYGWTKRCDSRKC